MAEKLITKSFERLLDKGKHRGFITYEELGKSLGKRNGTIENIERAFIIIVDEKITLVEKKSQFQSNKKKETSNTSEEKSTDKSDDPIRMYLREMGGVELLSREGEIAIAKRIEAGKDVMINALTQSPLVGKKIFEWKEQIESQQLLVRDIIDIDSTYEDFEAIAQQIADAGYIPLLQSHSPWIWTENFFSRHNLLMTDGNNGYDAVPTKTLFADTPEFVMHWSKVKEWYEKGWYGYKGRAWGDNQAPFTNGEAAFWFGSAASFGGMKGVLPNFTTNPILYWDSVTGGKEYPTFIGGAANWILNGHTEEEYKGLAKFIEFMGSPEMDLYYHNMTGYAAVTKGGIELAETINFYRTSPYHKAVGDQLGLEGSTIPGGYRAGNWPQIREVIYENVEPMLNGDISVEKALGNMDKGAAKLLKQFAKTL